MEFSTEFSTTSFSKHPRLELRTAIIIRSIIPSQEARDGVWGKKSENAPLASIENSVAKSLLGWGNACHSHVRLVQ